MRQKATEPEKTLSWKQWYNPARDVAPTRFVIEGESMVVPVHPSLSGGPVGRDSLDGLPRELAFPKEKVYLQVGPVQQESTQL